MVYRAGGCNMAPTMKKNEWWTYSGASSTARVSGPLASFVTVGEVAPRDAAAILADCQDFIERNEAHGLIADYSHARVLLDADSLHRSAVGVVAHGGALALPTALLVRPDELPMWRTYCDLMARSGIVRAAFISEPDARDWALREARIHALDLAWRRSRVPA
jgi:hypothetical protein